MIYKGKELDINNYFDFLDFMYLLRTGVQPENFESKERWLLFLQKVKEYQMLIASAQHHIYMNKKDIKHYEEIRSLNPQVILDDIMDILRIYGIRRNRIKKQIPKDRMLKIYAAYCRLDARKPEMDDKLRKLGKKIKEIENKDDLTRGEKIIQINYIKAEINEIKRDRSNYITYMWKLNNFNAFQLSFQTAIYKVFLAEINLKKNTWEKQQKYMNEQFIKVHGNNSDDCDRINILFVHGGMIKCLTNKHNVISIRARIKSIYGDYSINAMHCNDCGINFINYKEWEYYTKFYGNMIVDFRWVNDTGEITNKFDFKCEYNKSPLYLCGYNVNTSLGLQASTRQRILKQILDENILDKYEIINYLNYFISTNGKIKNHELAKLKWEEDLMFVRNYKFSEQSEIEISRVEKY